MLLLILLVGHRIASLWSERNKIGSRLQIRIVSIFSILSIIPTVLMALFSATFFHNGIESWFNEKNKIALDEALTVAHAYLEEHKKDMINDGLCVAKSLEVNLSQFPQITENFSENAETIGNIIEHYLQLKNISSSLLLDKACHVIARSKYSAQLHFEVITNDQIIESTTKQIFILPTREKDKIVAIANIKSPTDENMYLLMERRVDSKILEHVAKAQQAVEEFNSLYYQRTSFEIAFIIMFLIIGFLLLLSAISVALIFSWHLIKPISRLIEASQKVRDGNLNIKVKQESAHEELVLLTKTFNQMIDKIRTQQQQLITNNKEIDERRKFTESILASVSSGIICLDSNLNITIFNHSAKNLLGKNLKKSTLIYDIIPEISILFNKIDGSLNVYEADITHIKHGEHRFFLARVAVLTEKDKTHGFVITFDDLTNLVTAQKKAAWADVARRVAHEIKNPLTPIQLSAQRIEKKYLSQIVNDRETFSALTDVIVRQVGDIKRLIDEFSFFAKLPDPVFKTCKIAETCKQAVFLMQNAYQDIQLIHTLENVENTTIFADERLIHQAVVNIIQNSVNALKSREHLHENKIWVSIDENPKQLIIKIEDNGPGLPTEQRDMLTKAYFTLMPKGTGLGLAIVKKIIQDHGGYIEFHDRKGGGASVWLYIQK